VRVVTRFVRKAEKELNIKHRVRVMVVPAPVIEGEPGKFGFGCFVPGAPNKKFDCQIVLAGDLDEVGLKVSEQHEFIEETLAHELAHYEQWRDGKPLQERGVRVRGKNIERVIKSR